MLVLILTQVACEIGEGRSALYNHLVLRVESNRTRAEIGKPIHVRFSITNGGTQYTYVVESTDTPVMDITIRSRSSGSVNLTWSSQNPDKVAHRLEWKPGESKVIEMVWTPTQEDILIGVVHIVGFAGLLYQDSKIIQSTNVDVCASNVCR